MAKRVPAALLEASAAGLRAIRPGEPTLALLSRPPAQAGDDEPPLERPAFGSTRILRS
jgi:hypothetical protein